jgi:hypothetical protein
MMPQTKGKHFPIRRLYLNQFERIKARIKTRTTCHWHGCAEGELMRRSPVICDLAWASYKRVSEERYVVGPTRVLTRLGD